MLEGLGGEKQKPELINSSVENAEMAICTSEVAGISMFAILISMPL